MGETDEVLLLKKALERQKKARFQAERILEEKSKQLYDVTRHLQSVNDRLEHILNEKASELDGVFINIIDPYVIMDLEFNVINMNASAKEFLGFDHTIEPLNLSQLVHKDYMEYTAKSIATLLEVGTLKNYRAKIIVGDGTKKFVEVNSSLIYDKERNPIAAQGIIRDITQESETKELLAQQKKELDIIVENSPLGIVLTDQGMIIKTNPRFVEMLGYKIGQLIGRHVKDISAPGDMDDSVELIQKMNSGKLDNFSIIKKYLRKDGDELLAKTSVSAFKNRKGEVEYQVAMVEDITEQRNLELQKEQLLKELEASNKGLKEYAHIVSHDLKSPLRSISALATWLGEDHKDVLNVDGLNNLQMMQEKIEAMDTLIDGILKYSSIDLASLENSNIDLNEIVTDIREIIFVPDHVRIVILNPLPEICADRTRIYQLFQNILSNAVNHIEADEGLVQISNSESPTHWHFRIEDNGIGIPKEYHDKIFKVFQSLDNQKHSSGIGLSIVQKIVDLYEGEIMLESEVGKGTVFNFTLKKS